jgi:hypothetical protein
MRWQQLHPAMLCAGPRYNHIHDGTKNTRDKAFRLQDVSLVTPLTQQHRRGRRSCLPLVLEHTL